MIADITYKAGLLGVTEEGIKDDLPQSTREAEFYNIGTKEPYIIRGEEIKQQKQLVSAIRRKNGQMEYKDLFLYTYRKQMDLVKRCVEALIIQEIRKIFENLKIMMGFEGII